MDWLSRIFDWLREQEAGFSAMAAIAVLAGIVFTGVRFLLGRRSQPTKETAPEEDPLLALPTGPVVAVLPFENLSRDPDQEYFSDGLTDDIITALSRFKDLFVIARNSTFRYRGQAVDVRQLNRELGARYVLEGSVQKAESRLRATAQLLDTKDGTHLWAETYDRDLSASNIFEVQDEITEQVVATIGSLDGVISRAHLAEIKRRPTQSLDAYEATLQYAAYYREHYVATEHARVREGLERAVELDPGYSTAWAILCMIYLDEYRFNYNPLPNPLDRALEAARRATALDNGNQLAHAALANAYFFRKEFDSFLTEAELTIALNPSRGSTLHSLGSRLNNLGDERGIVLIRKAMKLDPLHPTVFNRPVADYHFARGEYEEAIVAAQKIDAPGASWPQIYLAAIYAELGRNSEAKTALEELLKLDPDLTVERFSEDWRKWNYRDEVILRWVRSTPQGRTTGLGRGAAWEGISHVA